MEGNKSQLIFFFLPRESHFRLLIYNLNNQRVNMKSICLSKKGRKRKKKTNCEIYLEGYHLKRVMRYEIEGYHKEITKKIYTLKVISLSIGQYNIYFNTRTE